MKYFITIGCWMVELILVASILVSMDYTFMQAMMLASMFLPVLLAMKYFLPQVKWERTHKEITGIVCLFLSFLVLEYLLLMCCHTWIKSYIDEMPSVLLNPVFLTLLLAVLFVTDTAIGKQLDKHLGKTPSSITFYSDRKSVTLQTEQILYVESNDAETWVHTLDGERYRNKTTISQWEQILEDGFLRTHRSFIVNINHVTKAESDAVMLGDITIPVSRKYKEVVATRIATTT
ncbi:MAG: LytTR family transcriptional regulator [Bacteroidaceae bacterium]|nr:LytTR family transcriptional regulator [Bacteroidaceae bacterium]